MKPDRCSFCKGKLYEGKTEFIAKVEDEVVSIKDVPAYVCENCGEAYFTPEISRKIDEVMRFLQRQTISPPNCSRRSRDGSLKSLEHQDLTQY